MFRRNLIHTLLLTLLVLATGVRGASACPRTDFVWAYDTGLPSCARVSPLEPNEFVVYNHCLASLTLAAGECPTCAGPQTIPPDDVGWIGFARGPGSDGDSVSVDWETGDTSGSAVFSFHINYCPQGDGCAAAPGTSGSAPWALVTLLAFCGLRRARRPRR